uniref:Uncharacterized protein n=1 Tax=Oncorhynchus mykiss TaxID=8022 RepID=A0A8C7NSR2_ONCMY
MLDQVVLIAGVTVLGVLEQGNFFSLQVTYARRKYLVSAPSTSGPPEFQRVFIAQSVSFLVILLLLFYLFVTYLYFKFFTAKVLWVLIGFSTLGILYSVCRFYLGLDLTQRSSTVLCLTEGERGSNEGRE